MCNDKVDEVVEECANALVATLASMGAAENDMPAGSMLHQESAAIHLSNAEIAHEVLYVEAGEEVPPTK
jgi:hypothetical protein